MEESCGTVDAQKHKEIQTYMRVLHLTYKQRVWLEWCNPGMEPADLKGEGCSTVDTQKHEELQTSM